MKRILFILTGFAYLFTNAQTYQWAKSMGASTFITIPNTARSVISDAVGNTHITGRFYGTNINFNPGQFPVNLSSASNSADVFFAKYTNGGACLWAKAIVGSFGHGQSIATDATGNVYITGEFYGSSGDFDPGPGTATLGALGGGGDIFLAKYDANGNYLWAHVIGGSGGDFSTSLGVDAAGDVFITGRFQSTTMDFDPGPAIANLSTNGNFDIFIAKYDAAGNYLWARNFGSTGIDASMGISVDAVGDAYITGYFQGTSVDFDPGPGIANLNSTGSDIFFAKYTTNGDYVWAKSIASGRGQSLSTDANGNVYLTGIFAGAAVDFDPGAGTMPLNSGAGSAMFFAKYTTNGNYLWAKSVPGADANAITNSVAGKIYLTGIFTGTVDFNPAPANATLVATSSTDAFFAKYDANGNYIWAKMISSPQNIVGNSIAVDASENAYLAGVFAGTGIDFDTGPGTATLSASPSSSMFYAKYAYCKTVLSTQHTICVGSTVTVNGHNYTASGNYSDTLYTAFGCDSISLTQVTVTSLQPTITINGKQTICKGEKIIITGNGANTYTWSSGFQTSTISVTPPGTTVYTLTGTFTNSPCQTKNTFTVTVMPCLGLDENDAARIQLSVYPNPAKTELFYTLNSSDKHYYMLSDGMGRVVAQGEHTGTKNRTDLSTYTRGVYALTISIGNVSRTFKVILE